MNDHKIGIVSLPALGIATVFVIGTSFILFRDVLNGATVTPGHVMTALALLAAVVSGHWMASSFRKRRYALALGHAFLVAATITYIGTVSGTRNAAQGVKANAGISQRNDERSAMDKVIDDLKNEISDLKKAEKVECRKVGDQCKKKQARTEAAELKLLNRENMRSRLGSSEVTNAGYKQLAKGFALMGWIPAGAEGWMENVLEFVMPWIAVLIAELGTVVYSSTALGHRPGKRAEVAGATLATATLASPAQTLASPPSPSGPKPGNRRRIHRVANVRKVSASVQPAANVIPFGKVNGQRVVEALMANDGPMTCTDLGHALGCSAGHVSRLWRQVADQVEATQQGRWVWLSLKADAPQKRAAAG